MPKHLLRIFVVVCTAALLAAGCSTITNARDRQTLLQQDYHTMNNEDLLRYFYELNDQIQTEERSGGGTAVGLGTGVGPLSLGVQKEVGGGGPSKELRQRRIDVQVEMKKRGVNP